MYNYQFCFLKFFLERLLSVIRMQFVALRSNLLNIQFILILGILILLCNDIAENPGPETDHAVNNNLTILHLNVRSIRNKLDDICNYLEDCDTACFSENSS